MSIEEILDQLDELIDRSWSLPLTGGRCVVDADKVRELLDDVRLNMPTEIRQAQSIVADRTEIINNAKKEAETIIARAEKRAAALVDQEEIVRQSKNKAAEIAQQAQQLCLGGDLGGHQVQDQNFQRTDMLRQRPLPVHDKDVFLVQGIKGG